MWRRMEAAAWKMTARLKQPQPEIHYPDSRVFESQLARLPITYPPNGKIEVASLYEQNAAGVWEEWHVVYVAGQENDAINAVGGWWDKPWFDLTDKGAQGLVAQVRLAEAGRKAKARQEAIDEAAERKRRRKQRNSDSIFRKCDGECNGECEGK